MSEKRKFSRVNFKIESKLITPEGTFGLKVVNISLKGLMAEVDPPAEREKIEKGTIEIRLVNSDIVLSFESALIHMENNQARFHFLKTDSESITHLRRLLELNTGNPNQIDNEIYYLVE